MFPVCQFEISPYISSVEVGVTYHLSIVCFSGFGTCLWYAWLFGRRWRRRREGKRNDLKFWILWDEGLGKVIGWNVQAFEVRVWAWRRLLIKG